MRHVYRELRGRAFSPSSRNAKHGFTLIEILVVISIIALLVAIFLPTLRKARAQSRRRVCLSNIHQLAVALYTYQSDHRGDAPRQWGIDPGTDQMALYAHPKPVRLGMLYPKYIGNDEDLFFCPDATENALLNKGETGPALFPWSNWGVKEWVYGSYEYRPRYDATPGGTGEYIGVDFNKNPSRTAIAADAFSGYIESWGPYPAHTPVESGPTMLYYNVAYLDGSGRAVKDDQSTSAVGGFTDKLEFRTRAAAPAQQDPFQTNPTIAGPALTLAAKYTGLNAAFNSKLPPADRSADERRQRDQILATTNHIDRGWTFLDTQ